MKFMRRLLLLVGVFLFSATVILYCTSRLQSFFPESRLHLFDERIASVDEEFMRRSPTLRANFARFQTCAAKKACNLDQIFEERNALIQKLWPTLLERLTVPNDWGEGHWSEEYHTRFQNDLQKVGGKERAKRCRPKMYYYRLSSGKIIHTYQGLLCP